ncbi:M1 family aminopeptidase [Terrimonas rubra]|uniref:Aminopeptidase N n=1 Tax=Terrimonas rubra TaxID=1035890 RepID=A0ABW6A688_9BACT
MKQTILVLAAVCCSLLTYAQHAEAPADTSWKKEYRETAPVINQLVHTKLDVKFDYNKSYLLGKAWLTLQPHFYATDSLTLDAKGMDIHQVALVKGSANQKLAYKYDGLFLRIKLDKSYKGKEKYTVYIEYTAKPDEFKVEGSEAITDAKGLYFINPKGEEANKPTQIWTQGETEASSVWFPTIDRPNQKTTQEIYMTVPAKYVTLSNGKLMSQKKNTDGTRTDYWKMDLPHAPYLFFMGVGDYAVITDKWKGKDVTYYVEKEYAPVARKIFGNTPEMMTYFSKITGVEYPWVKYAQIVGRDYVSGAMENTTATLHQESAQQDARELIDGNEWEHVIAHELFHHWFGDYVTSESWSNLTVNESFANYSETLWNEYKYGKDYADDKGYGELQGYLGSNSESKDLVRFHYRDKEDMFDAVSYNKGGRILHMLRNQIGDSAFFKGMNNYLTTNKYKAAEAHQLRLAFEEVTGRDMNPFFNQWYFNNGHPVVDISYDYNDEKGIATVIVKQLQKSGYLYQLPLAVEIYNGATKTRHQVLASQAVDSFTFKYTKRPDLINVDADKVTLWVKKDNKTLDNFIHQYKYAGNYLDRKEAVDFAAKNATETKAIDLLKTALKDKYDGLRTYTLQKLDFKNAALKKAVEPVISDLAKNDPKSTIRGNAIGALGAYEPTAAYLDIFKKAIYDSSYTVAGNALYALSATGDPLAQTAAVELYKKPAKRVLQSAIMAQLFSSDDETIAGKLVEDFTRMSLNDKFENAVGFGTYLAKLKNAGLVKKGVEAIIDFREKIPASYRAQTDAYINGMILKQIVDAKTKASQAAPNDAALKELVEFLNSKISADDKKGF